MRKIIITALLITCLGNVIVQNKNTSILEKIDIIDKELNTVLEIRKAAGFAIVILIVDAKRFLI